MIESVNFDPRIMLLTTKLAPVNIITFPPMPQALWLFNPYANAIQIQLVSLDELLSFVNDTIVVKSHEHKIVWAVFKPYYVGQFNVSNLFMT